MVTRNKTGLTENDVNPEFPGEWRAHLIQYASLASMLLCVLCSITQTPSTFQLLGSPVLRRAGDTKSEVVDLVR